MGAAGRAAPGEEAERAESTSLGSRSRTAPTPSWRRRWRLRPRAGRFEARARRREKRFIFLRRRAAASKAADASERGGFSAATARRRAPRRSAAAARALARSSANRCSRCQAGPPESHVGARVYPHRRLLARAHSAGGRGPRRGARGGGGHRADTSPALVPRRARRGHESYAASTRRSARAGMSRAFTPAAMLLRGFARGVARARASAPRRRGERRGSLSGPRRARASPSRAGSGGRRRAGRAASPRACETRESESRAPVAGAGRRVRPGSGV